MTCPITEHLLPCPTCGHIPFIYDMGTHWAIYDPTCDMFVDRISRREKAIAAWNMHTQQKKNTHE
ncbi:hypothetical protein [Bifidobacterium cuniculi]|uniref:Uncharacterized protein n=1 Tax=Bifidobacterium cuniculi TaxID=1688 RepID=A0A087B506_9BIFI|nr:hypothetical protein [Bifidobacterium cuniculi]KFI66106.1 hypothetical protein BCUN_0610 [Bifidobacterium cuniculi]